MYTSADIKNVFQTAERIMTENAALLSELDAAMGDGDLGLYMQRGFVKGAHVAESLDETPSKLLRTIGMCIMEEAPSTLGTLIGLFIRGAGSALPKDAAEFDFAAFLAMMQRGYDEIVKRGGAKLGEKTILDSLHPAIEAMKKAYAEGASEKDCLEAGLAGAQTGLAAATQMKAVHGRPAYFGEKTIGMQDGGATVGMLLFKSIYAAFV